MPGLCANIFVIAAVHFQYEGGRLARSCENES